MSKAKIVKGEGRRDWELVFSDQARGIPIDFKHVLANEVSFHWEYNPNRVHPIAIYGGIGYTTYLYAIVWAEHLQDALDIAADEGLLDSIMVDEKDADENEEYASLGNAGEPFDLENVAAVDLSTKDFSPELFVAFATAREAGASTIVDYM